MENYTRLKKKWTYNYETRERGTIDQQRTFDKGTGVTFGELECQSRCLFISFQKVLSVHQPTEKEGYQENTGGTMENPKTETTVTVVTEKMFLVLHFSSKCTNRTNEEK